MKSEIYKQLQEDYPNVLYSEYFPYIWELIDEKDCAIQQEHKISLYNLTKDLENFKKEITKLVLKKKNYDISIFSTSTIRVAEHIPENIKRTTERVVELFYKYCKWYGEILQKNPILLATNLTSSGLIKVLDCYRQTYISLEFKPGETLDQFSYRLIEDSKRI